MCGIFGVVNRYALNDGQKAFLRSAMQAGQVRGLHGSGFMGANSKGEVAHASAAMPGTAFLVSKHIKPIKDELGSLRSLVGHNRHATVGAHTDENCHPFAFDHIVGVHNGSISDHIMNYVDPDKSHAVDSGRVFAAISRADDAIEVLPKLHTGAYSLVWYNTQENTLNLARNHQRPMNLAVSHNGVYLASELGMLTWLLARHKLDDWHHKSIAFGETDVHKLYTIELDDLSKVECQPYIPVAPPSRITVWKNQKKDKRPPKAKPSQTLLELEKKSIPKEVDDIISRFRGRYGLKRTTKDEKEAVASTLYEHRASEYYTDVEEIARKYPSTKPVVEFIKENLMYMNGELYPTAFGSMCMEESSADPDIMRIAGFLSNDIGAKEEKWRAMMRLSAPDTNDEMVDCYTNLPCLDHEDGSCVTTMFPIVEAVIFSYELRPTGEIICIGRPVSGTKIDLFVQEEDENEIVWAGYACGEQYLDCLDDAQIAGLWQELSTRDDEDIPF